MQLGCRDDRFEASGIGHRGVGADRHHHRRVLQPPAQDALDPRAQIPLPLVPVRHVPHPVILAGIRGGEHSEHAL